VSTWAHPYDHAASRPAPVCTLARGDSLALNRAIDTKRPVRTTPTLASRGAWTVGRGRTAPRPRS
jgi:hypothetical protein